MSVKIYMSISVVFVAQCTFNVALEQLWQDAIRSKLV